MTLNDLERPKRTLVQKIYVSDDVMKTKRDTAWISIEDVRIGNRLCWVEWSRDR